MVDNNKNSLNSNCGKQKEDIDEKSILANNFQSFIFPIHGDSDFPQKPNSLFIGRSSLKINLLGALKQSEKTGGCFLVGGYRGVGKSLLVSEVMDDYRSERRPRPLIDIPVNISDSKVLKFRGVMTDCISSLLRKARDITISGSIQNLIYSSLIMAVIALVFSHYSIDSNLPVAPWLLDFKLVDIQIFCIFALSFGILLIYFYLGIYFLEKWKKITLSNQVRSIAATVVIMGILFLAPIIIDKYLLLNISIRIHCLILFLTSLFFTIYTYFYSKNINRLIQISSKLLEDSYCDEELESGTSFSSTAGISLSDKRKRKKTRLSDRQIENEFISVLKYANKYVNVVFLFDELDKLGDFKVQGLDGGKRDQIDSFLGRMKSFLKNGHSQFIFIGDREIVDNYHSESGSKNALYEGIFDQIFYVPSLLSDYSDRRPDVLHSMVMEYVLNILMGKKQLECFYTDEGFANLARLETHSIVDRSSCMQSKYVFWAITGKENCTEEELALEKSTYQFKNLQYILNRFVRFLTIHSWGNYRRLILLINQFVEQPKLENYHRHSTQCTVKVRVINDIASKYQNILEQSSLNIFSRAKNKIAFMRLGKTKIQYLHLDKKDTTRVLLAANMYEMIAWEMSSKLAESDDKLIISSINSSVDLVKFHEVPFSRSYLDRTSEGIDIHAEPHLTSSIGDIIDKVNYPFIRKIRRGLFEYRFFSHHEEEIKYISKTVGAKASNYVFGLSSYDNVKSFYQSQLEHYKKNDSDYENSGQGRAVIEMILGDINFWERSYDKAFSHYSDSIAILKKILRTPDQLDWRGTGGVSFSSHYYLTRVLLKKGLMSEIRGSYALSWRYYREAVSVSKESLGEAYIGENQNDKMSIQQVIGSIYKKGEVRHIRHREVLILALLALNCVYLKSGQSQRKEIDGFNKSCYYKPYDYESWSYKKISFMGEVDNEIVYQNQIVRYFSNDFANMSSDLSVFVKKLLKENKQFVGKKSIRNIDFTSSLVLVTWLQATLIVQVRKLLARGNKNLALKEMLFPKLRGASNKIDEYVYSYPITYNKLNSDNPNEFEIMAYFKFYDLIASSLIELGYKVRASHVYSNIILVYLGIMESFPWEKNNYPQEKSAKFDTRINDQFLNYFLKKHAVANRVHDQGLFKFQKDSWEYSKSAGDDKANKNFRKRVQSGIEGKNLTFWHHSHAKNLNIIMSIWYWQGVNKIGTLVGHSIENDHMEFMNTISVDNVLPQYQKNLSILFWLKGRHHLYLINSNKASKKNNIKIAILYLYKSFEHSEKISGSGGTASWPPCSLVLYNLLQALEQAAKQYGSTDRVGLVYAIENDMQAAVPRNFLDIDAIYILIENACKDLKGITNTDSSFYKRQLQNKYFLYDDLKDPVFKIEWMFLHILQNGCDDHADKAREIRNNITEKIFKSNLAKAD